MGKDETTTRLKSATTRHRVSISSTFYVRIFRTNFLTWNWRRVATSRLRNAFSKWLHFFAVKLRTYLFVRLSITSVRWFSIQNMSGKKCKSSIGCAWPPKSNQYNDRDVVIVRSDERPLNTSRAYILVKRFCDANSSISHFTPAFWVLMFGYGYVDP